MDNGIEEKTCMRCGLIQPNEVLDDLKANIKKLKEDAKIKNKKILQLREEVSRLRCAYRRSISEKIFKVTL
jgi:Zn-finger protein